MTDKEKITCHVCGKDAVLTGTHTIRVHGPKDDRCSGSGADPAKLAVVGYRVWMKVPGGKDSWTHAATFDTKTQAYDWGSACLFDTNVDELMGQPTKATAPEALDAANGVPDGMEAQDTPPWQEPSAATVIHDHDTPESEQEPTVDEYEFSEIQPRYPAHFAFGQPEDEPEAIEPDFPPYVAPDVSVPPASEPDSTMLVLGQVVAVQLAAGVMKGVLEQTPDGTLTVRVLNPTAPELTP